MEMPFTVESIRRRKDAELKIFEKKGAFDPIELDAVSMKVLDSRKNYLLQRLN
jgi:hypothetical protein